MGAGMVGTSRPEVEEQRRGLFVDSHGNLRAPANNPRSVEMLNSSRRDPETGGVGSSFQTLQNAVPGQSHLLPHSTNPVQVLKEKWKAFRFRNAYGILILIQIVMYAISLWVVSPRRVMMPHKQANWKLGSPDRLMEKCAFTVGGKFILELRRFIVPMFLHWNPLHIIFNIGFQVSYGVEVYNMYGPSAYLCLFFVCGCCGVMLTESFELSGVGASTACYGLLGAYAAQIWMVWDLMNDEMWRWFHKMMILGTCVSLVVWEIIGWSHLDHFGHLGGLLSGFPLGVILYQGQMMPSSAMKRKKICAGTLAAGIVICTLKIFFTGSAAFLDKGNGATYTWQERCEREWQVGYPHL